MLSSRLLFGLLFPLMVQADDKESKVVTGFLWGHPDELEVDSKIAALEEKVSELQKDKTKLESGVSSCKEELKDQGRNAKVLSARVAALEKRVAFYTWTKAEIKNAAPGSIVPFNHVITNEGQAYDKRTGVFTAPVDGDYQFSWTVLVLAGDQFNAILHKNTKDEGAYQGIAQADSSAINNNASGSNTAILTLKKGDKVWVQTNAWGRNRTIHGKGHSTFAGFLL